jgi:hypothetical protein
VPASGVVDALDVAKIASLAWSRVLHLWHAMSWTSSVAKKLPASASSKASPRRPARRRPGGAQLERTDAQLRASATGFSARLLRRLGRRAEDNRARSAREADRRTFSADQVTSRRRPVSTS